MLPGLVALLLAVTAIREAPTSAPRADGASQVTPAMDEGAARFVPAPYLMYRADRGWGGGLLLFVYEHTSSPEVRSDWVSLELSWSQSGPRYVNVAGEAVRIAGTPIRNLTVARWKYDTDAPYWGEGAALPAGGSPGSGTPPEAYRYTARMPEFATTFRGDLAPPVLWFGRLRYSYLDVVRPSALLEQERPEGWRGGALAVCSAGVVLDTRDQELWTRRGVLAEASLFASPELPSTSDFATWGANATVRGYLPVWGGASLALRGLAEFRGGDVPFFEWVSTEGLYGGEGLGGATTLRGLARDRLAGPQKLLANVELRQPLALLEVFGRSLDVGAAVGTDAGWARQPGRAPVRAAGAFAGMRLLVDRAGGVRIDVGYAGQGPAVYFVVDDAF